MTTEHVFDDGVRLAQNLTVRLPEDLRAIARAAAAYQGLSEGEFTRRALAARAEAAGFPVPRVAGRCAAIRSVPVPATPPAPRLQQDPPGLEGLADMLAGRDRDRRNG